MKAGLRASALRYYEEQGLLPKANRLSGKRVYDDSILERLNVIQLAKMAGFRLDDIRTLLATASERPPRAWKRLTEVKRVELERESFRLAVMKTVLTKLDRCSCATLEDCGRIFEVALARYKVRRG
jgi:DNA-binding transcriptional MerR regulator